MAGGGTSRGPCSSPTSRSHCDRQMPGQTRSEQSSDGQCLVLLLLLLLLLTRPAAEHAAQLRAAPCLTGSHRVVQEGGPATGEMTSVQTELGTGDIRPADRSPPPALE